MLFRYHIIHTKVFNRTPFRHTFSARRLFSSTKYFTFVVASFISFHFFNGFTHSVLLCYIQYLSVFSDFSDVLSFFTMYFHPKCSYVAVLCDAVVAFHQFDFSHQHSSWIASRPHIRSTPKKRQQPSMRRVFCARKLNLAKKYVRCTVLTIPQSLPWRSKHLLIHLFNTFTRDPLFDSDQFRGAIKCYILLSGVVNSGCKWSCEFCVSFI